MTVETGAPMTEGAVWIRGVLAVRGSLPSVASVVARACILVARALLKRDAAGAHAAREGEQNGNHRG